MVAAAAAVYHYYSIVTYYRGASELAVLLILYRTPKRHLCPLARRTA